MVSLYITTERTLEVGHLMSDHVHMLTLIPQNTQWHELLGFLKGKVLYQLHEHILEEERILRDNTSGQEGTMSQQ